MPLPLPALPMPLHGHSQCGWHGVGHGTSAVCLYSVTRDSLKGVRSGVSLCNSQGRIFPTQAIIGGQGARAGDTQGHCQGQGPHMVVFSLGRKKKTGCKHKIHFLEKECAFPTCLFIYKPWEHWVPLLWGPWAPSGTALCPCSPALLQTGSANSALSREQALFLGHKWLWLLKAGFRS